MSLTPAPKEIQAGRPSRTTASSAPLDEFETLARRELRRLVNGIFSESEISREESAATPPGQSESQVVAIYDLCKRLGIYVPEGVPPLPEAPKKPKWSRHDEPDNSGGSERAFDPEEPFDFDNHPDPDWKSVPPPWNGGKSAREGTFMMDRLPSNKQMRKLGLELRREVHRTDAVAKTEIRSQGRIGTSRPVFTHTETKERTPIPTKRTTARIALTEANRAESHCGKKKDDDCIAWHQEPEPLGAASGALVVRQQASESPIPAQQDRAIGKTKKAKALIVVKGAKARVVEQEKIESHRAAHKATSLANAEKNRARIESKKRGQRQNARVRNASTTESGGDQRKRW